MKQLQLSTSAGRFGEAFPLGNGQIGAMFYGGIQKDRIELSENTFFSGDGEHQQNRLNAAASFSKMRSLVEAKDYTNAEKQQEKFIGRQLNYGTNLPVGTLWIEQDAKEQDMKDYVRSLDIEHGVAECSYHGIHKRAWASHPDKLLIYEIKSERKMSWKLTMENYGERGGIQYERGSICFLNHACETMHCAETIGTLLGGFWGIDTDGEIVVEEDCLHIQHAVFVNLYLAMETDFQAKRASDSLQKAARGKVDRAMKQPLEVLRKRHEADVYKQMSRCSLELGQSQDGMLEKTAFLFQFGRYLLLQSSREDSVLPAHLQGIWNDNVACRIGWTCDMHLDINTQMNYWPAEVTNLSETAMPLFRWITGELKGNGSFSAKNNYGLQGWVAEIVSNAWGFTAPYWAVPISPCPTGGVWILTHMWEHYLAGKDMLFLKETAYPAYQSAVEFFSEYVFLNQSGYYSSGPSVSPENSFVKDGEVHYMSNGCTYEILMIRELLDQFIKMSEILKIQNKITKKAIEILPLLIPYRILEDNTIAEWSHDYPSADSQHRHTSHLLGLFPFAQITPEETPDLAEAAEMSIQKKLVPSENWEDTGWARSMLMLYEARLHHGEQAYGHIQAMFAGLLEPNGMIIHPPTRGAGSFDNVYELDGNTGLTSCVAELLLQSHRERIQILPALPKAWKNGTVKGLRARGGVLVTIVWKEGKLLEAELMAKEKGSYRVIYRNRELSVELDAGRSCKLTEEMFYAENK